MGKSVTVVCPGLKGTAGNRATLVGASGEQLKVFMLTDDRNDLDLAEFAAGLYSLRIETVYEIVVKQIVIP